MIDNYLNINIFFDFGTNDEHHITVVKSSWVLDGWSIFRLHTNPFFDTREYEIEFTYGTRDKNNVNVILENVYAQVDDEGHNLQLLVDIKDHWKEGM